LGAVFSSVVGNGFGDRKQTGDDDDNYLKVAS